MIIQEEEHLADQLIGEIPFMLLTTQLKPSRLRIRLSRNSMARTEHTPKQILKSRDHTTCPSGNPSAKKEAINRQQDEANVAELPIGQPAALPLSRTLMLRSRRPSPPNLKDLQLQCLLTRNRWK